MIKTLVFDWDGTLHNTATLYNKAFRKSYAWLVSEGLAPEKEYTEEETSYYLGMNVPTMWKIFMPELDSQKKEIAAAMISNEMDRLITVGEAQLYPGTEDVLAKLKALGYKLVILSNCRHNYLELHKKCFQLDCFFDGYYAAQDYNFAPKEEIFCEIAKNFPGEYVMIGDRDSDLKPALVHHLLSVACDYGFGREGEMDKAEYHIQSIKELPDLICKM